MTIATEVEPRMQGDTAELDELLRLCDAKLDPLFWPSSRPFALSAWYGHVPFAHWLVASARPAAIVELGTHEELIARNGYYTDLYNKQLLEEELARV